MDVRSSGSFQCKKWTLFTFCLIEIIVTVVVASVATKLVDTYVDNNYSIGWQYTQEDIRNIKSLAKTLIYVASALAILFNLLGLCGSYKEHYCMSMAYAVLMTIVAVFSIGSAVRAPALWGSFVLNVLICVLSYSFVTDLRRIRCHAFSTPVYVTGAVPPPHTVVHVAGPSYGQQPTAQYYGNQTNPNWQQPPPYAGETKAYP